jgi:biopolymer transport protein ExbB
VNLLYSVTDFIAQGGEVLWVLFAACLLLWFLILERAWFLRITWPKLAADLIDQWNQRPDCASWQASKIRQETVSRARLALHAQLPLIKVLVALCPLLGLLGTVLGMIGVFEVIAVSGNDDAQAMARGVYRATIPTMSGLVVALTGIYFTVRLRQLADRATHRLQDALQLQSSSSGRQVV